MKKMVCLLVTFLLCVGSACAEFDSTGAGSDAMCFTGRSDVFTYYSLNSLWEIDNETGEAFDYPDFNNCYLVDVCDDGSVMLVNNENQLVITNLYGENEILPLIDEGFIMLMADYDDRLFYFADDKKLSVIDLKTRKKESLMEDVWMRFLAVDADGIWYSDDAGLYLLSFGEHRSEKVIDADVGFFQRVSDDVFYASATTGTVWAYSLKDGTQRQVLEQPAYSFAFNDSAQQALVISRPDNKLQWYDLKRETQWLLELDKGETPETINAMGGCLYIKTMQSRQNADGVNLQAVYCVYDGKLTPVFKETFEEMQDDAGM